MPLRVHHRHTKNENIFYDRTGDGKKRKRRGGGRVRTFHPDALCATAKSFKIIKLLAALIWCTTTEWLFHNDENKHI